MSQLSLSSYVFNSHLIIGKEEEEEEELIVEGSEPSKELSLLNSIGQLLL